MDDIKRDPFEEYIKQTEPAKKSLYTYSMEKGKQDIDPSKQDIEISDSVTNKTKQHIQRLFEEFEYERFFGRTEVMDILKITASPASGTAALQGDLSR